MKPWRTAAREDRADSCGIFLVGRVDEVRVRWVAKVFTRGRGEAGEAEVMECGAGFALTSYLPRSVVGVQALLADSLAVEAPAVAGVAAAGAGQ